MSVLERQHSPFLHSSWQGHLSQRILSDLTPSQPCSRLACVLCSLIIAFSITGTMSSTSFLSPSSSLLLPSLSKYTLPISQSILFTTTITTTNKSFFLYYFTLCWQPAKYKTFHLMLTIIPTVGITSHLTEEEKGMEILKHLLSHRRRDVTVDCHSGHSPRCDSPPNLHSPLCDSLYHFNL